jgi:predicted nucleic acid-binding protein
MPAQELTFVDTNVLVYAHDASESDKQPIAEALLRELWRRGTGVLSTQVLQEFYVVATRKYDPPMSRDLARRLVAHYANWRVVGVDLPLIVSASELEEVHSLSFWDALVVEAARRAGARRLATEDMQDGREFGDLRIHDPFREASST